MMDAAWMEVDVSPAVGDVMVAFPTKAGPRRAEAVRDPIMAGLLLLADGERQVAIVTLDWCGIRRGTMAALRAAVDARCGAGAVSVQVACSHTHAGPETLFLFGGSPDAPYLAAALAAIADGIAALRGQLAPATIRYAARDLALNHNRRVPGRESSLALNVIPGETTGPTDPQLSLLEIAVGERQLWLWHYTGHPLTLGPANRAFSADFPGEVRRLLRRAGRDTAFLQGAAANIHVHRCMESDDAALLAIGGRIATELTALAADLAPLPVRGLRQTQRDLTVPNRIDPALTVDIELQVLSLGGLALAFVPGEYWVEFQLALKAAAPLPVLLVGYANDWPGYIPDRAAYTTGGYGVDAHTTDPAPLSRTAVPPGTGETIYTALLHALLQLHGS